VKQQWMVSVQFASRCADWIELLMRFAGSWSGAEVGALFEQLDEENDLKPKARRARQT
jgi:hypothetical protein